MGDGADIGVIGLGVMGRNLALNLAEHGAKVAVTNRSPAPIAGLLADPDAAGKILIPCDGVDALVAVLAAPRLVLLMVPAGAATDAQIDALLPRLSPGDVIIDGGNAHYPDSTRRAARCAVEGIDFLGAGVSGGAEGARHGPAIMVGGSTEAYERARPWLEAIAARAGDAPCCARLGSGGAGHFVKMIHNGIEYADMALLSESVWLLRRAGMDWPAVAAAFTAWADGPLGGYLTEITAAILDTSDPETDAPMVEMVSDRAGAKGTGAWTVAAALDFGVAVPSIAEAVFSRALSNDAASRAALASEAVPGDKVVVALADMGSALLAARICIYAQGFALLTAASEAEGWGLDPAAAARVWRAGCILRGPLLERIAAAYGRRPDLPILLADADLGAVVSAGEDAWRRVLGAAIKARMPAPVLATTLAYWDGLRTSPLPTAMVQAQRDTFGAHGFGRVDRAGRHHGPWHRG